MVSLEDFKFTAEQLKSVDELHQSVSSSHPDACMRELARFLRGNSFSVSSASEKYSAYRKWRVEQKVDNILDQDYPKADLVRKIIPYQYEGFTNDGMPIYWEQTGKINTAGLTKHVNTDDVVASHIYGVEKLNQLCQESSKKLGKKVDLFATVLDLNGVGMGHADAIPMLRACSALDAKYYPERVGRVLIINAPWIMPALYKLVQVFLDETTKSRVQVLSSVDELSKYIPKEHIPAEYGGEAKWSMPKIEASALPDPDAGFEKKNVGAGSKQEYTLKVKPGETFTWFFKSKGDYDVDFSISMLPHGATSPVGIKIKSRCVTSKGSYKLPEDAPGEATMTVLFDNSFSYFNSKDILYLLDVTQVDLNQE